MPTYSPDEPRVSELTSTAGTVIVRDPCGLSGREFCGEIVRAELSGEVSEFDALCLQAILAMTEASAFVADYLDMAEAVAASPHERAVVAESRAAYNLLQGSPRAAAERCWNALRVCQVCGQAF
jgi:hypothetical protein